MRPPNVRACVEVSHRLTLEGHYGGVLIFLSSSVRAFVELVVCLAFPFMTSSVRLSFAAAHFSCGRISCSQSDQSGKPFFLQAKKHPLGSLTYHEQCGGALPKPFAFFALERVCASVRLRVRGQSKCSLRLANVPRLARLVTSRANKSHLITTEC